MWVVLKMTILLSSFVLKNNGSSEDDNSIIAFALKNNGSVFESFLLEICNMSNQELFLRITHTPRFICQYEGAILVFCSYIYFMITIATIIASSLFLIFFSF
jgi:hypothetical protein